MFKIGATQMPEPKAITVTEEKIWSSNAGRGTDGTMVGDVVATKTKLQISWAIMTGAQVSTLSKAVAPAFISVYFKNPNTNAYETKTFYAGTPTYPVYSYVNGLPTYRNVTLDLIEK